MGKLAEAIAKGLAICAKASKGPWFPGYTDDPAYMNCRFVSTIAQPPHHDDGNLSDQEPESVIAVTLLQTPYLAGVDECDDNMLFIAYAREALPWALVNLQKSLDASITMQGELVGLRTEVEDARKLFDYLRTVLGPEDLDYADDIIRVMSNRFKAWDEQPVNCDCGGMVEVCKIDTTNSPVYQCTCTHCGEVGAVYSIRAESIKLWNRRRKWEKAQDANGG